ncbi:serine/threonine protein kinase [Kitasatospora sp. NPDC004240]
MADGTKAVVDTSAADGSADEAALAAAIDELTDEAAELADEDTGPSAGEETSEITAPLSAAEIAAELRAGGARKAAAKDGPAERGKSTGRPDGSPEPTIDTRDTGTLPRTLPAPLRHSGDKIGNRYLLEECISQTETFSSWRAVDEKLRRAVGIHLMAAGHQRARAVLAAAKSAALLGDPRFVQVLDAVQVGELVYVVREWLPHASDLAKLLADGPMEPHEAYQMVRQVTDAVAAAHKRGQAHLRLTPRCVLRTDSGQYRINGIAVDAALRGLPAEGDTDDAERADTRAIGALLFAALTHRWPFPEDRYDLRGLPKDLREVAPDQVRADVHKGLSELAARALFDRPPHHAEPITTPEQLARAIALMPRIRQPEPELPAFTAPPRHHSLPTAPTPTRVIATPGTVPAPAPVQPVRRRGRALRQAAKLTAWTIALGAIGVASWQLVDQLRNNEQQTPVSQPEITPVPTVQAVTRTPVPIPVEAAISYNPGGNSPSTHLLKTVYDGDAGTAWSTYGYDEQLAPGGFKAGTGLLIDLGSVQSVSTVNVQFIGATTAELRMPNAQVAANPAQAQPNSFTVLDKASGSTVNFTLDAPKTTRYLLIWLTSLPKDPTDSKYRGAIAEVKVAG